MYVPFALLVSIGKFVKVNACREAMYYCIDS